MNSTENRNSGVKIEVHLIQNFAPSNLNRDDTGQPKSAYFGGVRRARISSQCSKRSARMQWMNSNPDFVGIRTRLLKAELSERLKSQERSDEQINNALNIFFTTFYSKMDGERTVVLLFISKEELNTCLEIINGNWNTLCNGEKLNGSAEKTASEKLKKAMISADVALFGRMLAENPERNTDGACQVAHPISTHRVEMEMDFYTAVDDLNPAEETGAGMMGIVGFNSACYYRYAVVDRDQLARNLSRKTERTKGTWKEELDGNDYAEADKVIEAFLKAMVYAIPTGKQNSFAAQNLPSFGMFVRRQGGVPISLANAFAKPIRPTHKDDDLVGLSVDALTQHWDDLKKVYGEQGAQTVACFHVAQKGRLNGLASYSKPSVEEAIKEVLKHVATNKEQ